jgi:hypothetical protein
VSLESNMSVLKPILLAFIFVAGVSALADAAPRPRNHGGYSYGTYGAQAPPPYESGGGYSSDPRTRDLEILSDEYKPGW